MSLSRISVSVFAVVFSMTGLTQAGDKYAAVAYSTKTGNWGYSFRWDSQEEAMRLAKHYAEDKTAEPLAWVRNGYIALALGQDRSKYGWAWAATAEQARELALKEARKLTTHCYVVCCVHSQHGLQTSAPVPVPIAKTPRAPIAPGPVVPGPITPTATPVVQRTAASGR